MSVLEQMLVDVLSMKIILNNTLRERKRETENYFINIY